MSEDILMVPIKVSLLIYNCSMRVVNCMFRKTKSVDQSGHIYELPSDYVRGDEDVCETACRILKDDLGILFDKNLLEVGQVLYFRKGGETRIEYFFVFSDVRLDLHLKKLDPETFIWHDAYNPPKTLRRYLKTVIQGWLEDDYFTNYICEN